MTPALPVPQPDADSAHYWAEARRGRLALRECAECRRRHFPPRFACPYCWSARLSWIEAGGGASVHTFTIMRRAPGAEWQPRLPYVVALVDLDEGPRMMANIVGADALGVAIGERVALCFEPRGEACVPQFRRCTAAAAHPGPPSGKP